MALLILSTGVLTACQPSPTKPVIANKRDGKLESIINSTEKPNASNIIEATDILNQDQIPSNLNYTLTGASNFNVKVNADISTPVTKSFPVVKVIKDTITQEQVEQIRKILLPGQSLYRPTNIVTKIQLQTLINYYTNELKLADDTTTKNEYQKILKRLMSDYEVAPETVELEPASTLFSFPEDIFALKTIYGKRIVKKDFMTYEWTDEGKARARADGIKGIFGITSYDPNKIQMEFNVIAHNSGIEISGIQQGLLFREYQTKNYLQPENARMRNVDGLTLDDAIIKAQNLVKNMGLDFSLVYACTDVRKADPGLGIVAYSCHRMVFKRSIKTIPQSYIVPAHLAGMEEYAPPYQGESIIVEMDNAGVRSFYWNDPIKYVETENNNVPLLSFNEIEDIFKKQIVLQNQAYPKDDNYIEFYRMIIDHVSLSAMPIRIANENASYRYIPVWDFCGKLISHYSDDYPKNTSGYYVLDENNERVVLSDESIQGSQNVSFLTINAIDGSIIDRSLGY